MASKNKEKSTKQIQIKYEETTPGQNEVLTISSFDGIEKKLEIFDCETCNLYTKGIIYHNCPRKQVPIKEEASLANQIVSDPNAKDSKGVPSKKVENNLKSFKCGYCDRTFKSEKSMHDHKKAKHNIPSVSKTVQGTGNPSLKTNKQVYTNMNMPYMVPPYFKCHYCPQHFKYNFILQDHMSRAFSIPQFCSICGQRFCTPMQLRQHQIFYHDMVFGPWSDSPWPRRPWYNKPMEYKNKEKTVQMAKKRPMTDTSNGQANSKRPRLNNPSHLTSQATSGDTCNVNKSKTNTGEFPLSTNIKVEPVEQTSAVRVEPTCSNVRIEPALNIKVEPVEQTSNVGVEPTCSNVRIEPVLNIKVEPLLNIKAEPTW